MRDTTFYFAGFSLLLAPIAWLFNDPRELYIGGLFINAAFMAASVPVLVRLAGDFGFARSRLTPWFLRQWCCGRHHSTKPILCFRDNAAFRPAVADRGCVHAVATWHLANRRPVRRACVRCLCAPSAIDHRPANLRADACGTGDAACYPLVAGGGRSPLR